MEGPLKPPFTKARHVLGKGKVPREHIVFWAWDPLLGEKKRGRLTVPKQLDEDPKAKREWIRSRVKAINELLAAGHVFKKKKGQTGFPSEPWAKGSGLVEMLDLILNIRKATNRVRSWETYKNVINSLKHFLKDRELSNIKAQSFTPIHAQAFSDWLMTERQITARTRNGYLANLKSLFADIKLRGGIKENPLVNIKKLRTDQGVRHRPFSEDEKIRILEWMEKNDPLLKNFCLGIYSTFLRPAELARIKKRDVRLAERRINVPAEIAKNRKGETIPLYAQGMKLFSEILPLVESSEQIIFKVKGYGGTRPVSENYFPQRHKVALRAVGLEGRDHTLYGWKHTGVIAAYKAGLDLKAIQALCRHHSVEMTDKYLRDLGLFKSPADLKKEW